MDNSWAQNINAARLTIIAKRFLLPATLSKFFFNKITHFLMDLNGHCVLQLLPTISPPNNSILRCSLTEVVVTSDHLLWLLFTNSVWI